MNQYAKPDSEYSKWYEAYKNGLTLKGVAQMFGVSKQAVHAVFKKHGWPTRGLNASKDCVSHIKKFDDSQLIEMKNKWDSIDTLTKGAIVENYVVCKLAELGMDVWRPILSSHKSDMGIFMEGRLVRIQVKTASYDPKLKRFRAMLQTRDKHGKHIRYTKGTVDFFVVYCPGIHDFYVIPGDVGVNNHSVTMIPHRKRFKEPTSYVWEEYQNAFHLLK